MEWLSDGTLLAAVLGGAFTVLLFYVERRLRRAPEHELLLLELEDLQRHFRSNLGVIDRMRNEVNGKNAKALEAGDLMLSPMHFEKLKVPESSIVFNVDSIRTVSKEYRNVMHHLSKRLRNRNIESQRLLDYLASDKVTTNTLDKYLQHLQDSFKLAMDTCAVCVDILERPKDLDGSDLPQNPHHELILEERPKS